ncbi:MAG TPA: hypothetical protein VNR62_05255, partial [Cellulomonas sp.]|nr:hypothetical protein [Cellulomonas sp.]
MLRRLLTTFVVAALTLVTLVVPAQASGSKDLLPSGSGETSCDATHRCRPAIEWRTSSYGPAAAGEVRVNRRTLFTVFAKAGERILLGSSSVGRLAGDAVVWAPGQIADSDLTSISLPAPAYSCVAQRALAGSAASMGQISTRTQELAGARSVDGSANAAGYVPCYYDVTTTGLHRVAFYGTAGASTDVQALPANSQQVATSSGTFPVETTSATASSAVLAWDVTVRSSAAASVTDVPGRAFTYAIAAFTGNNPRAVAWTYYLNTLDGFRYLVDTNGFDPNGFVLYGNRVGFLDSDGVTPLNHDVVGIGANVQSLQQLAGGVHLAAPEYPLSFEPLAAETLGALGIPVVPTKPTLENLSFSGHASGSQTYVKQGGTFSFDVGGPGTYEVVVSADGTDYDPGLGANATVRGVVSGGTFPRTVTVGWDGKANNGTVLPAKLGYPMRATLRAGEYHAPMMDVENSVNGGPSITLLNPPGGVCPFSNVSSTGTNCTRAFYDDRSYVTADGTLVGTAVGGPLCSAHIGPANPVLFANPTTGFDSTGTQRAWGNTNGNNANTYCPTTGTLAALGDGKGLDLWTYFPSEERTASLDILALPTAPTAADDAWSTAHDATLVATGVLANDTGTSLAATKTTDPAHGTATL